MESLKFNKDLLETFIAESATNLEMLKQGVELMLKSNLHSYLINCEELCKTATNASNGLWTDFVAKNMSNATTFDLKAAETEKMYRDGFSMAVADMIQENMELSPVNAAYCASAFLTAANNKFESKMTFSVGQYIANEFHFDLNTQLSDLVLACLVLQGKNIGQQAWEKLSKSIKAIKPFDKNDQFKTVKYVPEIYIEEIDLLICITKSGKTTVFLAPETVQDLNQNCQC